MSLYCVAYLLGCLPELGNFAICYLAKSEKLAKWGLKSGIVVATVIAKFHFCNYSE
jgi:hypothetical protein